VQLVDERLIYNDCTQCTTVLEYKVVAVLVWPLTRGVGSLHKDCCQVAYFEAAELKTGPIKIPAA
jgi:hypothetical protein